MTPRVLIVDDDRAECELLADALRAEGFDPEWTEAPEAALRMASERPFEVVVTDLNMPRMSGNDLCRRLAETVPQLPVVVVTAFGSIELAVEAMRAGAYDFVTKPFDAEAVALVLRRAVDHHTLRREVDALRRAVKPSSGLGELLGTSHAMRRVYDVVERIADGEAPVLITGESGTGKELVARELHRRGSRHAGPFVAVNCSAMPEALLESELFGHAKGAFTDARAAHDGLLVAANGGTLLLDEIGEMPVGLQPKLLRALQERVVRPLGSNVEIPFDVRIVAATNRDLETAIEDREFREDLYYRINVIHLELPPLRARSGDTLLLAQAFLSDIAVRSAKKINGFTVRAAERLLAYDWPGNVRELRNCVERAVALNQGELIDIGDLPQKVRDYHSRHVIVAGDDPSELVPLEEVERKYILRVLHACRGNKSLTAQVLGLSRKTLYRRLEAFGEMGDRAGTRGSANAAASGSGTGAGTPSSETGAAGEPSS